MANSAYLPFKCSVKHLPNEPTFMPGFGMVKAHLDRLLDPQCWTRMLCFEKQTNFIKNQNKTFLFNIELCANQRPEGRSSTFYFIIDVWAQIQLNIDNLAQWLKIFICQCWTDRILSRSPHDRKFVGSNPAGSYETRF